MTSPLQPIDDTLVRFWSIARLVDDGGNDWMQYAILPANQTSVEVEPGTYSIQAVNGASEEGVEVIISVTQQLSAVIYLG